MRIPKNIIDDIVNSIDLIEYMEVRGVSGKRQGGGFKAKCPFHNDSDPSLSVPAGKQYFRCFGCDVGGDVLTFIMLYDSITFPQAVKTAAAYAGVTLPKDEGISAEEIKRRQDRDMLNAVYMAAARYCHKILPPDLREHLQTNYGFTDEFINEKQIGYDDGNLFNYLFNTLGFSQEELLSSGLFVKTQRGAKDFFNTRIVFWYWKNGFPVYAIGRETEYTKNLKDDKYEVNRKYKKLLTHTEERTYVSSEAENKFIYNEERFTNPFNRPTYGIITEGITDAMLAEQKGIPVMSPVTTNFRKNDIENLKRVARHLPAIYIVNDSEENESGLKAAQATAKELSSAGINAYITRIPRPKGVAKVDLNDFLKTVPDEAAFREFLGKNSTSYLDFLIEKSNDHKESGDKAMAHQLINEALVEAKSMDPITQEDFFKTLAKQTGTRIGVVREQFKLLVEKERQSPTYKETEEFFEQEREQSDGYKLYKILLERGARFYRAGGFENTDVIMTLDGEIFGVNAEESRFTMMLLDEFNLNYVEHKTKATIFELKTKAYLNAARVKRQTWMYCDKERRALYLPIGYEEKRVVRITPAGIDLVNNGEDEGIFIARPADFMEPWVYDPNINKELVARKFVKEFVDGAPCKPSEALLLLITILSYPLKRYVDTVPIVKVHGTSGTGKTQIVKAVANLFFGTEKLGEMSEASIFDQAGKRMIIILDNIEKIDGRLLEQFLLYAASNGEREIRDKAKNSGTISQPVDCLPLLTAIHPFEKVELLNRSFDIITHEKYHKEEIDTTALNESLRANRAKYHSLWMQILQAAISDLDTMRSKRKIVVSNFPKHFKSRLNAFYVVMWHIADIFLGQCGWTKGEIEDLVFSWIEDQSRVGDEQEKDISQIYYYFSLIAQYIRDDTHKDWIEEELEIATMQQGRIVIAATARQLHTAFSRAARESGQRYYFTSARQLGTRLSNDQKVMERNGWTVKMRQRRDKSGNFIHELSCPVNFIPETPVLGSMIAGTEWVGEDGQEK
jgi:DNA primase catalytic core